MAECLRGSTATFEIVDSRMGFVDRVLNLRDSS